MCKIDNVEETSIGKHISCSCKIINQYRDSLKQCDMILYYVFEMLLYLGSVKYLGQ